MRNKSNVRNDRGWSNASTFNDTSDEMSPVSGSWADASTATLASNSAKTTNSIVHPAGNNVTTLKPANSSSPHSTSDLLPPNHLNGSVSTTPLFTSFPDSSGAHADAYYGLASVTFICVCLGCAMSFAGMCKLKKYEESLH